MGREPTIGSICAENQITKQAAMGVPSFVSAMMQRCHGSHVYHGITENQNFIGINSTVNDDQVQLATQSKNVHKWK